MPHKTIRNHRLEVADVFHVHQEEFLDGWSMLHEPQKSKFPKMGISEGASLGASSCEERRLIDDARHVKITVRLIY
jgi:hypothetical protein